MAHLVIGPTNCGKSTFIEKNNIRPVIFGFDIEQEPVPQEGAIHYNLLYGAGKKADGSWALEKEPILGKILASGKIDQVTILVSPIAELLERARKRSVVEKSREEIGDYRSEFWINVINESNLFHLYETLFDMLEDKGLEFDVVNSSAAVMGYPRTDRTLVHRTLRGDFLEIPKMEGIDAVLSLPGAEYQQVLLPRGRYTGKIHEHLQGSRGQTFAEFGNVDFRGRSVLDIGSALGDMLFRAERRGASRLVGIEMMEKRFEASTAITSLLGSAVELHNDDFLNIEFSEMFDDVLLLNVIHHVSDVRAFLHKAAALANDRLIVEFPTLNDQKFRSLGGIPRWVPGFVLSQLPVLGVSHADQDQTFVMNLAAVGRILSETKTFKVERLNSPMSGRELVTFHF